MKFRALVAAVACFGAVAALPASSSAAPIGPLVPIGPVLPICSLIDTCGPVIDSGPSGTLNASTATFTFHRDVAPLNYIAFKCRLDGGSTTSCSSPAGYSGLSEGSHTFYVYGEKSHFALCGSPIPHPCFPSDGTTNTTSRTFTLDRTNPVAAFASGPANLSTITTNTAAFGFSSTDATAVTFACKLDGGAASACTSPTNIGPLANGTHTFAVTPTDAAGNVGATISRAFTVAIPGNPVTPATTPQTKTVKKCKKVKVKKHGKVVRKKNGKIKYKKKCRNVQVPVV